MRSVGGYVEDTECGSGGRRPAMGIAERDKEDDSKTLKAKARATGRLEEKPRTREMGLTCNV